VSTPEGGDLPDICPRCDERTVRVLTASPAPGAWTMYSCGTCFYSWRSTEPAYATDPAGYPVAFKIDPSAIGDMPVVPTVPPRRS
jgi:vanillate/4-hydroxybenzoate decarboxylase subunit D